MLRYEHGSVTSSPIRNLWQNDQTSNRPTDGPTIPPANAPIKNGDMSVHRDVTLNPMSVIFQKYFYLHRSISFFRFLSLFQKSKRVFYFALYVYAHIFFLYKVFVWWMYIIDWLMRDGWMVSKARAEYNVILKLVGGVGGWLKNVYNLFLRFAFPHA